MTSNSTASTGAVPSDLVEDKIISDSNSSLGDQEKAQEVQPLKEEGQVDNEKSETVTALLQVVGAFFLMFNSWYVPSIHCLVLERGCQHI
jgi:hypothetical protein